MTDLPKHPIQELKAALAEHLPWHGARIAFLAQFLLALLKVRSVNLAELATGFGGKAKVDSHYKRLQRFFRGFDLDYDDLARLLVRLAPVGDGPWRLTMDRTNWQFGKVDINVLVLGIAYRGIALPVFWSVLDKAGNSNTAERIALMERFLAVFGPDRIAAFRLPRVCRRGLVPLAAKIRHPVPPAPQARHPDTQQLEPNAALRHAVRFIETRRMPTSARSPPGLGLLRVHLRAAPG